MKFSTVAKLTRARYGTICQPAISDLSKSITVVVAIAGYSTPVDTQERRMSRVVPSGLVWGERGST